MHLVLELDVAQLRTGNISCMLSGRQTCLTLNFSIVAVDHAWFHSQTRIKQKKEKERKKEKMNHSILLTHEGKRKVLTTNHFNVKTLFSIVL